MAKKVIVSRHGQTYSNKDGLMTGQTDPHLTSQGVVDAYQLGVKVKSLHGEVDLIVTSNMTRTNHTAMVANLHLQAKTMTCDNGLKDKTHGLLDGTEIEYALPIIEALQDDEVHPEHGGESNIAFKDRVTNSICKYLYSAEVCIQFHQ